MPTVVIIHAAEDTLPARALAEKVRQAKLDVVLEKTGDDLRSALSTANVAIGLWSPRSTDQPELADHAKFAKGKTKLIHATMQSAPPPEPFRNEPTVNLTGWRGEDDFPAWRELAKVVTDKAGVAPLPPPAPKPASGFFQPGAVSPGAAGAAPAAPGAQRQAPQSRQAAPQPRAQQPAAQRPAPQRAERAQEPASEKKGGGGMLIAIIAIVVILLGAGGGYWFMTQNSDTAAYESVDTTSVSALRDFLAGEPAAADRERAEADLARLEQEALSDARAANSVDAWEAFLRDFPGSAEAVYAQGQIQQLRLQQSAAPPALGPDGQPLPLGPDGQPAPVDLNAPPAATTAAPATTTPPTTGPATIITPPAPVEEPPTEEPPSATPTP